MDIATWIAIIGLILGLIGALIKIVWDMSQKRLETLESAMTLHATREEVSHLKEALEKELEAVKKSLDSAMLAVQHMDRENDANAAALFNKLEAIRESLADARETIAGFGSTYVTRKEYYEDRR
jgi:hypothetical protein